MDHYAEETFSLIGVAPELLYIHYMGHEAETEFCPFEEKFYSPTLGLSVYCKGNKGNQRCLGALLGCPFLIQQTISTKLNRVSHGKAGQNKDFTRILPA